MRGYAAVGLFNPKTEMNVGSALRAVYCYQAALLAIQGKRFQKCGTDTMKAWRHIPIIETDDLFAVIPYDCVPVAIEVGGIRSLEAFNHPERAFYIFGPEDGSLQEKVLLRCHTSVSIPSAYCMNLAATVNVVLYDRLAKQLRAEKKVGDARGN